MNLDDFKHFLEKFEIDKSSISTLTCNKKIIELNENLFLVNNDFKLEDNIVYTDFMIFIKLKSGIKPTKFLLDFISKKSPNKIELNEKQALNFTYGKIPNITKNIRNNFFYLVLNSNSPIGILEKSNNNISNYFNIGEYLHEN